MNPLVSGIEKAKNGMRDRSTQEESKNTWLFSVQEKAMARFKEVGFPRAKDEKWKYTDVRPFSQIAFERQAVPLSKDLIAGFQLPRLTGQDPEAVLTFVNGHLCTSLSRFDGVHQKLRIQTLEAALRDTTDRVRPHLSVGLKDEDDGFKLLNAASLGSGIYLHVEEGDLRPLHLVFVSSPMETPIVSHLRNIIVLAKRSRAEIIEHHVGFGIETYLTNAVTEIYAGEGSQIEHYKFQEEKDNAFHVGHLRIYQASRSRVVSHLLSLGGALVRNEIDVRLQGEDGACTLNGLFVGMGKQHVDNHTVIQHETVGCKSEEFYKGILADEASGTFQGNILVSENAQKSDASQVNKNLLLSDFATMNTKPQLEIYADNVKCSHGATVGQLDAEALFYLKTRGMGNDEASRLLTQAFGSEILNIMEASSAKEYATRAFGTWLEKQVAKGSGR